MTIVASATTEYTDLQSAVHGRLRREQRDINKIDLQRAKRYGMVEKGRNGRLKYTYGGVVFIYDPVENREVTSYRSADSTLSTSGTKVTKPIILPKKEITTTDVGVNLNKYLTDLSFSSDPSPISSNHFNRHRDNEKRKIVNDKSSWSSHSVLVVDMSGSMRKDDVNGARCRSDAIFLSIARNYVQQPLMAKSRSKRDLITIIIMKEDAEVVLECEPTDWVLYNKLIDMREWTNLRPSGPGNYIPALDEAERMLMRNTGGKCALSLLFFSDGKPSDIYLNHHDFSNRMGSIASKFGRRLTVSCIGMAVEGEDFSVLSEMATEAQSFGAIASFGKPTMDADSLSNIISSLASSLTTTMTEITNIDTGKIRELRMDIRREKVDTPQDVYLTDEWTAYRSSDSERTGRYVGSIWSWNYKINDFVQIVDPRCSICWTETDALKRKHSDGIYTGIHGTLCPSCGGHSFCKHCCSSIANMSKYDSQNCRQCRKDKKSGRLIEKSVPSFDVAVKDTIFGEGAERIVRKFSFLHNMNNFFVGPVFVAKESRFVEEQSSSKNKSIGDSSSSGSSSRRRRRDYHREFMRTQSIASEYARKFNKALEDIVDHFDPKHRDYIIGQVKLIPKIEFLEPMIVETYDPSKKNKNNVEGIYELLVEPFLDGKYEKFNDNMGMVKGQSQGIPEKELMSELFEEDEKDLMGAFSNLQLDFDKLFGQRDVGHRLGAICEEDEEEEDDDDVDDYNENEEEKIIEAIHVKRSQSGKYDFSAIKKEYVPQAFSHFTYENSQTHFMVVDLQGVLKYNDSGDGTSCYYLTDPVIHDQRMNKGKKKKEKTNQQSTRPWSFGRTDRGRKGMKAFFQTHKCNDLCRLLGLEHRSPTNCTSIGRVIF